MSQPPETAEEKEGEKEEENREETLEIHPYKPPVHKPWVSLGSEKELKKNLLKTLLQRSESTDVSQSNKY